ncbi:hypothetical protein [Paenibacillus sp. FSL A5-0031]|uniref:hypothetical protein n=1 Tax=Paenibacillus sp. FSL A5-0031 TaxID=1920420 RepID=UPI0015C38F74|nr:hypothetical protein [Paenibacillus sp. FSL A5-0031]
MPTGGTLGAFSDEASVASYAKDSVAEYRARLEGQIGAEQLPHSHRIGSYPATDLE